MSEKDLFENLTGIVPKPFDAPKGNPANEHAKKLAKEKSSKKAVSPNKEFYTIKDGKILKIVVKHNGAYSSYIAKKEKVDKETFGKWMKAWIAEGKFIPEHELDETTSRIQKELAFKMSK